MHLKTDNIEIMINDKVDEVIEKIFETLLNRYQIALEIFSLTVFIFCIINVIK